MMIVMALGAKLVTRALVTEGAVSRWQASLEIVVTTLEQQLKDVGLSQTGKYCLFWARSSFLSQCAVYAL